jgi:hypothetical protein
LWKRKLAWYFMQNAGRGIWRKFSGLSRGYGTASLGNYSNKIKQLIPWSSVLLEKLQSLFWSRNSLPFVKPEGSLPCLQGPATGPYREPDKSGPHPKPYFLRSIATIYAHLRLRLPTGIVRSSFPTKLFIHFLSLNACYMSRASHPSCFVLPNNIWSVRSEAGSWPVGCWDRGFESRSRHGCLSLSVLCCPV